MPEAAERSPGFPTLAVSNASASRSYLQPLSVVARGVAIGGSAGVLGWRPGDGLDRATGVGLERYAEKDCKEIADDHRVGVWVLDLARDACPVPNH